MPPASKDPSLDLIILPEVFVIFQYPSEGQIPQDVLKLITDCTEQCRFVSVTRTEEEISIVCSQKDNTNPPEGATRWRCIKIRGPMDFGLTGIMCDFTTPLKQAGVSIFALSTWNTDYILVPEAKIDETVKVLGEDGWRFKSK